MAVHIADNDAVEAKLASIRKDGAGELHVVSDFDRTLTQEFIDGKQACGSIAQMREGGYLTPDYPKRAFALFDEYYPFEESVNLSVEDKAAKMQEWWEKHLQLGIECGMGKSVVDDIVSKKSLRFRAGALDLIDVLHEKGIPLLIFSAGLGDVITGYLRDLGKLYGTVHIISNFYDYGSNGEVKGYKSAIVHTFNKNESLLKNTPYEGIAASRRNVILLGDTLGDLSMVSGASHDTLLSVGFLNKANDERLPLYEKEYDVVITDDGPMDWVLDAVKPL